MILEPKSTQDLYVYFYVKRNIVKKNLVDAFQHIL